MTSSAGSDRKYLLERVDDAAVVQLYADEFRALPLREKTLIWHLSRAALAGRDIFYDQKHAQNLEMRDVLEAIVTAPGATTPSRSLAGSGHAAAAAGRMAARVSTPGVAAVDIDPETYAEVLRYTKLFWINSGPYNNKSARKFVLTCTTAAFARAAHAAARSGARFPTANGETLDELLTRLEPMFFDPKVDPIVTAKTPPPGNDILEASANNLYVDVTMKDLAGFSEQYPLNSRLVKQNGALVEEVYRAGGRYGAQIAAIVQHLEAAIPCATEPMAHALRALVKLYQTGEDRDREAYDVAWLQDEASPVDTVNGFIEVYLDARGSKGAWEGLVFFVNREKTTDIRRLAVAAQWFEEQMPWDRRYRKQDVRGITANAFDVVVETAMRAR